MGYNLPEATPAQWGRMGKAERVEMLSAGRRMVEQASMGHGENVNRLEWGGGFEGGSAPVVSFAMAGAAEELRQALGLGACPFARDAAGEDAIYSGFQLLSRDEPDARALGADILSACWAAGMPLLEPRDPRYLGAQEEELIKSDIAHACFSLGCHGRAAEMGLDVDPAWMAHRSKDYPAMGCMAVGWGDAEAFAALVEAGLSLAPLRLGNSETPLGPWSWIMDNNGDIEGMAKVLLAAGLDPRAPGRDGRTPLTEMKAGLRTSLAALRVESLLLAMEERDILGSVAPSPAGASGKRARPGL